MQCPSHEVSAGRGRVECHREYRDWQMSAHDARTCNPQASARRADLTIVADIQQREH